MKLLAHSLALVLLSLTHASAQEVPVAPDLSSIADGKSWAVTHADVGNLQTDGKFAVRLVAEGDSANGIVGLALPRSLTFSTGSTVYFRPFNFRAEDPIRRRSVQYVAWPTNTWEHLRKNAPGQFENSVSPVPDPDGWFHARIEITDSQVKVFVDHSKEPSLVTRRLSSGGVKRAVGLFVDSADGLYSNLAVSHATP